MKILKKNFFFFFFFFFFEIGNFFSKWEKSHLNPIGKGAEFRPLRTPKKIPAATQKKTKIGLQDRLLLNAGQKYCRMLQGEHSAILLTFIKLRFVIIIFVLSIFEWPRKTGYTVTSK